MYGIQTQPESMSHFHGVSDPHMNSLSLQVELEVYMIKVMSCDTEMLQEMIDSDIKAEFDDVLTSNQLGLSNVDSLDLLKNLDDLDTPFKFDSRYHSVDEVLNHPPGQWSQQQSVCQDVSTYFDDSLSSSNNVMVNPNSVMPVHQQQHYAPVPSPVPPHQPLLTVNTQINTY